MNSFDADWLALRASADARARSSALESALAVALSAAGAGGEAAPWRAVDLACGTGANTVRLAPRLPGNAEWRLVDADERLLHLAGAACMQLVDVSRGRVAATIECADLAGPALEHVCAGATLVTASALLDLVSASWLERLAAACARARAVGLFVLDYDGRRACSPTDPDDRAAHEAFDRHQRGDKGFGPALGPAASAHATEAFRAHGYRVLRARSDWLLDARDAALQRQLLAGWARAAIEAAPAERARFERWLERRLALVDASGATLAVGHEDLLVLPEPRAS
jgi:hypothetical protein